MYSKMTKYRKFLSLGTSNVCPWCRQLSQPILFTLQTRCIELQTTETNTGIFTCKHNNFTKKIIFDLDFQRHETSCCDFCAGFAKGAMTAYEAISSDGRMKLISIIDV